MVATRCQRAAAEQAADRAVELSPPANASATTSRSSSESESMRMRTAAGNLKFMARWALRRGCAPGCERRVRGGQTKVIHARPLCAIAYALGRIRTGELDICDPGGFDYPYREPLLSACIQHTNSMKPTIEAYLDWKDDEMQRLKTENESLKRRLGEGSAIDLRDGDAPPPVKKRTLRDAHDEQQIAILKRVKQEKIDAEGARDRAVEDLEDVQDDLVNPLTLTVNALQTKIDELHALACQVDPVAADAIKNRSN